MAATDDLVGAVLRRLDGLISQRRDHLVSVGANHHDRSAGHIQGLMEARAELAAEAKKFRMHDFDADDEASEPLMI